MLSIDLEKIFIFLESGLTSHPSSKKNFAAIGAKRLLVSYGEVSFIYDGVNWKRVNSNPWEVFNAFKKESKTTIFGYFGYDLKNYLECLSSLNEDFVGAPDLFWFEPIEQYEWTTSEQIPTVISNYVSHLSNETIETNEFRLIDPGLEESHYKNKVLELQQAIKEGFFYELNLSRLQTYQNPGLNGWQLYTKMKEVGKVPFGAFLNLGNGIEVCCASPERFLKKEGSKLLSQPIKGTRPRSLDTKEDHANYEDLLSSEKDQAENLMIVDLVRNDLNRVAQKGSVKVTELFSIHSFETVYQMVSTIEAELDSDYSEIDVIKSTFPMGSMTGAPKVEVMQWIEKLENYKRGIYSGAIGYINTDENFDFNVVIRTAILKNGFIYYATGGAITSDSDPQSEWHETVVKSAALEAIFKNK